MKKTGGPVPSPTYASKEARTKFFPDSYERIFSRIFVLRFDVYYRGWESDKFSRERIIYPDGKIIYCHYNNPNYWMLSCNHEATLRLSLAKLKEHDDRLNYYMADGHPAFIETFRYWMRKIFK